MSTTRFDRQAFLEAALVPITPDQIQSARHAAARNATDADELRTFLSMLGIDDA